MRSVVVTGASGYIGAALTQRLADHTDQIIRVTRETSRLAPITVDNDGLTVTDICGDIADQSLWRDLYETYRFDVIFHLAGQTSAYSARENPEADFAANVLPMLRILAACKSAATPPALIFAGAATEVGVTTAGPVDEAAPDRPDTIYDLHKLMAETYLKLAVRDGIVKGGTLRLANVYGPGGKSASSDRGILNRMVTTAINGQTITLYGDGSQIRDYVYLDDVIDAFLSAAREADRLAGRHFLIGSGAPTTIADAFGTVARLVQSESGSEVPIRSQPWPEQALAIEFRNFHADTTSFSRLTGWTAPTDLETGIGRTIAAFMPGLNGASERKHA